MKNEIVIFENQNVRLEVSLKDETVWLSLEQISKLFDRDRTVVLRHINNIFKEVELNKEEVIAKFAHTTLHGAIENKTQTRMLDFYNLDVIISVGYRVKSKNGILFRKWASSVLKDYMLKGVAINNKRLEFLEKSVKLIEIANRSSDRISDSEAKDILNVIGEYTKSLDLLDDYDHRTLTKIKGKKDGRIIKYNECLELISKLRFNNESNIFGIERNHGLESILNDIYLTFDNKDVYESIELKACNFLYTLIKNHPFVDGNKRIAATLFIYFLNYYGLLYKDNKQIIDNNTLTAMTLLIAESNPKEKEIIIDLVMNFLN